jgi:hypothetical protein
MKNQEQKAKNCEKEKKTALNINGYTDVLGVVTQRFITVVRSRSIFYDVGKL